MTIASNNTESILLTVDVEDWFQVENLRTAFPHRGWTSCELRVERNVNRLLDLFDSSLPGIDKACGSNGHRSVGNFSTTPDSSRIRATFFVLGWIAERLPHLVREIHQRGHEVASHGYDHRLCSQYTASELRKDLTDSKALLEDIIGAQIHGYRAPSFSVSEELLGLLEGCGYCYDSSYNSFQFNHRYGNLDRLLSPSVGVASRHLSGLFELPISNLTLGPAVLPAGGGAYFRLIPSSVFRFLVRLILNRHKAYVFYIHPWEVDPDQPRVGELSSLSRFRHYTNLKSTMHRLSGLLETLSHCRFVTCKDYLDRLQIQSC